MSGASNYRVIQVGSSGAAASAAVSTAATTKPTGTETLHFYGRHVLLPLVSLGNHVQFLLLCLVGCVPTYVSEFTRRHDADRYGSERPPVLAVFLYSSVVGASCCFLLTLVGFVQMAAYFRGAPSSSVPGYLQDQARRRNIGCRNPWRLVALVDIAGDAGMFFASGYMILTFGYTTRSLLALVLSALLFAVDLSLATDQFCSCFWLSLVQYLCMTSEVRRSARAMEPDYATIKSGITRAMWGFLCFLPAGGFVAFVFVLSSRSCPKFLSVELQHSVDVRCPTVDGPWILLVSSLE